MKKLYWRPSKVSRIELLLIALVAVVSVAAVENMPRVRRQPYYAQKIAAARLAEEAQAAIKAEKRARSIVIDPEADPTGSGMLGSTVTKITSNTGHLPSKQTSTNPNFAAVVVHLLKRADVEEGSAVAVGLSGSFPAINLAVFAALETLNTKPIVIASAASSEWGATDINFTWLDMEELLFEKDLISFKSVAASRGGIDDRGFGIAKDGRWLLDEAIARAGVTKIVPKSLTDAIDTRMTLYYEHAGEQNIAAYINVGGGSASVGTAVGKRLFKPGLNTEVPKGATDSVMTRFIEEGVPVLHFSSVNKLAERFGLPIAPIEPQRVGIGGVYAKSEYNPWYALFGILLTFGCMTVLLKLDLSQTFILTGRRKAAQPAKQDLPDDDKLDDSQT